LSCDGRQVWVLPDDTAAGFSLSLEAGWVSPSYGVKVPSKVLVWTTRSRPPIVVSYLFADVRLGPTARGAVTDSLCVRFS